MGAPRESSATTYLAICDHTRRARRPRPRRRRDAPPGRGDRRGERGLAPFRLLRGIEATSCRTARSTSRTTCSPSSTGCRSACMRGSAGAGSRSRSACSRRCAIRLRSCLSHPKGRILNHRPENALDLEQVFEVALETGVAVEVNGLPDRLDLSGGHVREALAAGVQDRLLDRRALDARAREHAALGHDGAPRRCAPRGRPEHASAGRAADALGGRVRRSRHVLVHLEPVRRAQRLGHLGSVCAA